ncbi:MAG: alpha/beta fold hydrolase [Calditrichaceae bacterium]|nr:alpha/beta fold hydrolase [Calditrichaceae bacterium]
MNLYYKKIGHGKPLIILHGLFGMSDNWLTISKRIAKRHTVYLLDQRNHGRSPHLDEFDYTILSHDLEEFLQQQNLDRVRIIGHSMGGKAAMCFALKFPERVEKMVIVDIALKKYNHPFFRNLLDFMDRFDLQSYTDRSEIDKAFKDVIPNPAVRHFILKNVSRRDDHSFGWKINVSSLSRNLDNIFAEVKPDKLFSGPVLVVRGAKSDYILDEDMAEISKFFPNNKLVTIPNAGHWLHVEEEDTFCEELKLFFHAN